MWRQCCAGDDLLYHLNMSTSVTGPWCMGNYSNGWWWIAHTAWQVWYSFLYWKPMAKWSAFPYCFYLCQMKATKCWRAHDVECTYVPPHRLTLTCHHTCWKWMRKIAVNKCVYLLHCFTIANIYVLYINIHNCNVWSQFVFGTRMHRVAPNAYFTGSFCRSHLESQ